MKRIVLVLLVLAVFLAGCAKPGCDGEGNTLEDFNFLKLGMSYEEIEACVGPYDRNVGSGIRILTYKLDDGSVRPVFRCHPGLPGIRPGAETTATIETSRED